MRSLLQEIRSCTHCAEHLALGSRPVLAASPESKILIIGQAPGSKVHASGIPWDDPSGVRLREWLGLSTESFYDPEQVAILPMGFCYPGRGKSGDLPPRPECAPLWHDRLLQKMPQLKLTLLIGQYAQKYYLKNRTAPRLTDTVQGFESYLPDFFPLPHPSPRNRFWLQKNPWFSESVVPYLQKMVSQALS